MNTFSNVMYCCDAKLSIITPVFSVTWFFRKKIEYADLLLKKHLLLLSVLKTVVLHHTFVKILIFFFLSEFLNEYKVQKKSIYVNMFCNLVTKLLTFSNVFTVVCDQLNAPRLNKSINLLLTKWTDPHFMNGSEIFEFFVVVALAYPNLLPVTLSTCRLTRGLSEAGLRVLRLFLLRSRRAKEDRPTRAWSPSTSTAFSCRCSSCNRCNQHFITTFTTAIIIHTL